MIHVLVLAPGDGVELHWQQPDYQPTRSELLTHPRDAYVVGVGDRMRFSVEILKDFYERPHHRTPIVEVARISREDDGTVMVWLRAADRQEQG